MSDNHSDIKNNEIKKRIILLPSNYWEDKYPTSCETNIVKRVSCQKTKNELNPLRTFISMNCFRHRGRLLQHIRHWRKPVAGEVKRYADKWSVFQAKKHP